MYNLDIYPIHIHEGKSVESLPGLIVLAPPRRCGRGRESDQLIVMIHLVGKTDITPQALEEWLEKKAGLFYSSPGSVTNAMRLMAEAINNELLDRNLKTAGNGSQVNGSLNLVVLRKDMLYSLVIGQSRLIVLSKTGAVEFTDRANNARGLGMNQAVTCLFNQKTINGDESILLAPIPSPNWTLPSLQDAGKLSVEAIGRRLISQRPAELRAALVRLAEGKGSSIYKPLLSVESPKVEKTKIGQPVPVVSFSKSNEKNPPSDQDELPLSGPGDDSYSDTNNEETVNEEETPGEYYTEQNPREVPVRLRQVDGRSSRDDHKNPRRAGRVTRSTKDAGLKEEQDPAKQPSKLSGFFKRSKHASGPVPRILYLLFAIAVPLVVVAIAASVYINQGKTQQFTYYLAESQKYIEQAQAAQDDPVMHSFNLQAALMYLKKANQYGSTAESKALLSSVQTQLDEIQGVVRLNMIPLGLSDRLGEVNISQMVATNTDLYLLDSQSGKALHYDLVGEEYVQDRNFDCGPNPNNPLNSIGKLVDIIGLPAGNSFNATVFGIDAYGNIEFCIPDEPGVVSSLIAPDAGWQEIKAISMYQNYLYVMDPGNNAVFSYPGRGILFEDKPTLFFDNFIPNMDLAVDFEIYADELYILRSNGEMVECTYSHMKDYKLTECLDPAPYKDMRNGQEQQAVTFPDSAFIQMRMTSAPDSSLYLLDAHGNGIYHFSLQRNLQKIFAPGFTDPEYSPSGEVTSVAFTPGRILFIAFGNQVFTATIP